MGQIKFCKYPQKSCYKLCEDNIQHNPKLTNLLYCDTDLGGIGSGSATDCGRLGTISAWDAGRELVLDPGAEPGAAGAPSEVSSSPLTCFWRARAIMLATRSLSTWDKILSYVVFQGEPKINIQIQFWH